MIPTRTFSDVCAELDARRHVTLGFERIDALLAALDHPERALRVLQVVGTNGKGTTAVALATTLETLGRSTGTYLSPHLLEYTERVRVGSRFASREEFAAGMEETISVADAHGIPASQFELLTAGAVKMFADRGLDWAILEAGLGARHDATTAAKPEAVLLTNVGMDHTEYLGETVEEIAAEKLGGLPENGLLFLGTADQEVVRVARETAARLGSRLVEATTVDERLPSGLPPYLRRNVSLGVRAAEALAGESLDGGALDRVVEGVVGALPGRFETFEVEGIPVVVDGGHNPSGIEASLAAMADRYPGRPLGVVFGALRDKDIRSMLSALRREADGLVLTRPEEGRALDPAQVMHEFEPQDRAGRPARVVHEAAKAVSAAAKEMRERNGVVLVTGSLYTGAAALRALRGHSES